MNLNRKITINQPAIFLWRKGSIDKQQEGSCPPVVYCPEAGFPLFLFRFLLAFFLLLRVAHDEAGEGADAGDPD